MSIKNAAGNRLMKPANSRLTGLYVASPGGLYIRHTKWQSRREEALFHRFQMGTVTPNGQCDASATSNRSIAHCLQLDAAAILLKCTRGQCRTTSDLGSVGRGEITSVSVSPLIPFNPFELMSSFTAHQPPRPTTLTPQTRPRKQGQGSEWIPLTC